MKARNLHPWDIPPTEAVAVQRRLATMVDHRNRLPQPPQVVAGVDLSPPDAEGFVTGAAVALALPELRTLEVRTSRVRPGMPYVPGLLSFREAPALIAALEQLTVGPEALLVDGQGIAHPRGLGIAAHLGVLFDTPAVGIAKSVLVGRYEEPGPNVGDWTPLVYRRETVGAALRTRNNVRPIFVSIGHGIDLLSAIELTLRCGRGLRLPEPTRLAHNAAAGRLAVGPYPEAERPL